MMKRLLALPLLLLAAFAAGAQTTLPVDVEIGYRWLDLDGNEDVFRTQINERDGLLLRALRISTNEFGHGVDRFRVDASDLGTGPAGALRIEAGNSDVWNARLSFRQADAFNFHPGVALGQHRIDRQRTNFDLDFELFPGRAIAPFLGVSYGTYDGPGLTTYTLGQDEFVLSSDLEESEREIRGGIAFNSGKFSGVVTQGWRSLETDETLTLFAGGEAGNNPGNVLGRPVNAIGIARDSNFDVTTPFTNAFVTAQVLPQLKLIANFSRFTAEGDGPELESASGSFASFRLSRFFTGFEDRVDSRAENRTWRGGLRAEYALSDTLDLTAAYRTDRRDLDGAAAFHTVFLNTVNFGGADPRAMLEEVFDLENALERNDDILEIGFAARQLGPFSLRATFQRTDQDVELSPSLEQIVIDGPEQRGEYDRSINTIDAVGAYGRNGFNASLALRRDRADDSILRTDFADRDRLRLRASYLFRKLVRVGVMAEQVDIENDQDYESESTNYGADFELMFGDRFSFRGAYTQFDADASALIRRPESFLTETWTYAEDGNSLEAGIGLFFSPVTLNADFFRFDNEGSNTLDLDRYRVRVVWKFLAAEWARDEYDETLFPSAAYRATRYGLYLKWMR